MSEKNIDFENEKEFDALIESSLGELPPDYLTDEVTPWRKATHRVIWGLALRMMTLEVLGLNYILPFAGTVLTLLGFRTLRRENKWFKACNVFNIIYSVSYFFSVVLDATVFDCGELATKIIIAVDIAVSFLLLICLWQAFRAVRRKAGLPGGAKSAAALIVWYAILASLGLINYEGVIIPILMIIFFIIMIRSLLMLSKELDEAGYAVNAAPVKVSDRALTVAICSVIAVCIICGYAFFNSYPMKWEEAQRAETAQITEIKENLLALGFPEDILKDISDEDILECDGAVHVVFSTKNYFHLTTGDELELSGVGVKLPGEGEKWRIFHHFEWVEKPWFYGTESLQLWPAYKETGGWYPYGELTGRVLYDKDGKTYTASYQFLGTETYTYDTVFWGESDSTDVFASFSLPNKGENQRGYVSYGIVPKNELQFVDSWVNYTHQITPLQYPVRSAAEHRMYGNGYYNFTFETVQHQFMYIPETNRTDLSDESDVLYVEEN